MLCIKFEYSLTRNGGIRRAIQDKGFRGRKDENYSILPLKLFHFTTKTIPFYHYFIKKSIQDKGFRGRKDENLFRLPIVE